MGHYNKEKAWSDFRVGVITFLGIFFVVLGVVFAGGDKGLLLKKTTLLNAHLFDVGGLKKGCSVSMGGMVVGRVKDIDFVKDTSISQIEVIMQIRSDMRSKVKIDSKPAVRTQGMLGDRYIDITRGTEEAGELPEGQALIGDQAGDFDKTLNQANEVLAQTEKLLAAVNTKEGTMGQLVYDEKLYTGLTQISEELKALILDFKKNPRRYIKFSLF